MKLPIRLPKPVYSFFNNKYTNNKYTLNKYVMYLVAAVALVQMIVFLTKNNLTALVVYIALALAMLLVTRNMTLILLVPLILVNLFLAGKIIKEGLENASDSDKKDSDKKEDSGAADGKKPDKKHDPLLLNGSAASSGGTAPPPEAFEPGSKTRAGVTGGPRVDYGATLENAYDNLNKILGDGGMNKLTSDTKNLVDQQKQLAEAMNNMGPLMNQASEMMKSFQSSGMMNMLPGASAGAPASAKK
jgi:hypothetical protein